MFQKLAAIADFADRNGQYDVASSATQIIKNAQLFDALRTLFDPGYSGLERDSSYWKRLQRGWSRGRMDRGIGLLLAINAERTKLNKQIAEYAAPLKEFQLKINEFYDKIRAGEADFGGGDLRQETSQLKKQLNEMLKLVDNKQLRKALDMRNRLNAQQIKALDKVKGLDEDTKSYLASVLRGEQPPQAKSSEKEVPGAIAPAPEYGPASIAKKTTEQKAIADWLKLQKIPRVEYDEGFSTPRSRGRASTIYARYGINPIVLAEFFKNNPDKKDEVLDLVGSKPFNKMFEDLRWALELEKKEKEKEAPVPATISPAPQKVEKAPSEMPVKPEPAPAPSDISAPAGSIPLLTTPPPKSPSRKKRDIELAQIQKAIEERAKQKAPIKPEVQSPTTLPEEKTPRVEKADDLVVSMAARIGRQITRLGRVQQLRKISMELEVEGPTDEEVDEAHLFQNARELGYDPAPDADIYETFPEGRERFDEEMDYDPTTTRLEMEEGPTFEDDERGQYDPLYEKHSREESIDSMLDSLYRRMESIIRLQEKTKSEEAKAMLEMELDKLQQEVRRLDKAKVLKKEKKLPEGWANDADDVVYIRKEHDEYCVPSPDGNEELAYYTNDRDDAIEKAKEMYGDDDILIKFHGSDLAEEEAEEFIDNLLLRPSGKGRIGEGV